MEISIIIPAFNEAERIGPTLRSFYNYLIQRKDSFEIIVVDDGSTDATVPFLNSMKSGIPNLIVIPSPANKGKGNAIRTGMLHAKGKIRIFSDADGSTPIDEFEKLIEPILKSQADISIGSRYLESSEINNPQPFLRRAWSRLANSVVQQILLPGIIDPHCGFKAFTASASERIFSQCEIDGWSFDLEVLSLARKMKLRINEVAVKWNNDERSKGRISQMPAEILSVYKIKKRLKKQTT